MGKISAKAVKIWKEKNKLIAVWVPYSMGEAIADYLQHYCQGDDFAARFRVFWFELLNLEKQGITLVNPIKTYSRDIRKELEEKYGKDLKTLCFKFPAKWATTDEKGRQVFCKFCSDSDPSQYKACQEIKKEIKNEFDKAGLDL